MYSTTENSEYNRTAGANLSYLKCKRYSNVFARLKAILKKLLEAKDHAIEAMGGKPAPFKMVISIIAILTGIGLSFIEATNISTIIAASTGLSSTLAIIVGALFACIGMLAGYMAESGPRDEFTGKRVFSQQQALGVLLVVVYLGGQYFVASRAEIGSDDTQGTLHTMTLYIVGIAVMEVLFGMLFFKTCLQVVTLLFFNLRVRMTGKRLDKSAKAVEELWQRHLFEVEMYNQANGTNMPHGGETPAIKDAREYYNNGGF